jgi:hypothetical protein
LFPLLLLADPLLFSAFWSCLAQLQHY